MIRHIVLFSARDLADLDAIEEGLRRLERIPAASRLEVSRNLRRDALENHIDLVVYGEFEDEAALDAYKAHPLYEEAVRIVRPLRELRFAVDIRARDAAPAHRPPARDRDRQVPAVGGP